MILMPFWPLYIDLLTFIVFRAHCPLFYHSHLPLSLWATYLLVLQCQWRYGDGGMEVPHHCSSICYHSVSIHGDFHSLLPDSAMGCSLFYSMMGYLQNRYHTSGGVFLETFHCSILWWSVSLHLSLFLEKWQIHHYWYISSWVPFSMPGVIILGGKRRTFHLRLQVPLSVTHFIVTLQ